MEKPYFAVENSSRNHRFSLKSGVLSFLSQFFRKVLTPLKIDQNQLLSWDRVQSELNLDLTQNQPKNFLKIGISKLKKNLIFNRI